MSIFVNSFTDELIRQHFDDDAYWCSISNSRRLTLTTFPSQSHFRVYAMFIIQVDNQLQIVEGTNSEQGYIGGAICAERSAIVKFRFLDAYRVCKLIITTDSHIPIYPGVLCREYLASVCDKDVPVVLESCNGDQMLVCKVGELYPFPLLYRFQNRFTLTKFAQEFASKMSIECSELVALARTKAMDAIQFDNKDDIHPLRLGAAVVFADNSVEVSWQKKGMEYGCTLDPVSQLVHEMEKRKAFAGPTESSLASTQPVMLVMVDQFGVCHAPVAMARSLLTEFGYSELPVVVHDAAGIIQTVVADALVPHPGGGRSVCGTDFALT